MSGPRNFRFSAPVLLGSGILLGAVVALFMAGAYSASGDARFCASCHSMEHVQGRLLLSNHKQFACVECHLPAAGLPVQLVYKARAGLNDLFHETLRTYPAAIRLSENGRGIVRGNCLRCHFSTVENTKMSGGKGDCMKCHRFLVHGRGLGKGGMNVE